jgi:hypothetical protein
MLKVQEKLLAYGFGVTFVVTMLVLAILYPTPSAFQYNVFKTVLAIAAAGVASMIPGFLSVQIASWIRAGGALGVFAVVFFYNPAALLKGGDTASNPFGQPPIPFGTGWVFVGYCNEDERLYVEGPYAAVAFRPGANDRGAIIPMVGDILLVKKARHVLIANYKTEGVTNQMTSPPLIHDPLTEADETGVVVAVGSFLIVRDVEVSGYPGRPVSIWCRIAVCDSGNDQCAAAVREASRHHA